MLCNDDIPVGSPAHYSVYVTDDGFSSAYEHPGNGYGCPKFEEAF
jgi:hypothetical protein